MSAATAGRLVADVQHFWQRALVDALADGQKATWERRAAAWAAARPRPGDYTGRATAAELAERDRRCATIAEACRHRATLGLGPGDLELLDTALGEVA